MNALTVACLCSVSFGIGILVGFAASGRNGAAWHAGTCMICGLEDVPCDPTETCANCVAEAEVYRPEVRA